MPSPELLFVHRALLAGDVTAPERVVSLCLLPLQRILKRRHIALPRDAVMDAAHDAILTYLQRPDRFDPDRSDLITYLIHIADFRLRDWLRSHRRVIVHELNMGTAADLEKWGTGDQAYASGCAVVSDVHIPPLPREFKALIVETLPDPRDRELLRLICEGRMETSVYAAVLDIQHLPGPQQQAEVKRHRDRIIKRLQRRRQEFRRAYDVV